MAGKILIVDDQPANLVAVESALAPLGREIVRASSGEHALRETLASQFAVILLDVNMPGMDGFETAAMLRSVSRTRETPVIFMTAHDASMMNARRAYDLGGFDYISKPLDLEILRSKVAAFVRLHEQAEQLHQQDVYIGVLGHDLRNPLNAIMFGAQMLMRRSTVVDADRKVVERIAAAADRMQGLIGDLLDFTRSRVGDGIPLTPTRVDVAQICRQVLEELQTANPTRSIELDCHGDVAGEWDANRLAQAISNVVGNALQHCQEDPIRIVVDGRGGELLRVDVTNKGYISESVRGRLFEPFRRGDSSSNGLGLGLYIVREIVRSHGGSVDVASDPSTNETTFSLLLPRPTASRVA